MRKHEAINELVDKFAVSVVYYGEFILKDSKIADRYYDDFISAVECIASHGERGMIAFARLLDDERIVVRVTAACYLIQFQTDRAVTILQEAAKLENRAIAMLALATLKRWEKGIYLDPATGLEVNK